MRVVLAGDLLHKIDDPAPHTWSAALGTFGASSKKNATGTYPRAALCSAARKRGKISVIW
jgi:hypothetical protein